jgi:tetratricopeptide (TPR) repeat protein
MAQCEKDRLIRDERSDALVRAVLVGDDRQGRTSGGRPLGGRAGTTLDVATTYNNIALVYKTQGKYEMAIGLVYNTQGKHEMALELYAKSLAIQIKTASKWAAFGRGEVDLDEANLDVANTYYKIAGVYKTQDKYEMAVWHFKKCLEIRIKVLGEDHPDVAFTYNMIGLVYNTQGKHEMALELYAKSLAIQIKTASKWAAFGRGEVDHA